jgi:hypothetical protein
MLDQDLMEKVFGRESQPLSLAPHQVQFQDLVQISIYVNLLSF